MHYNRFDSAVLGDIEGLDKLLAIAGSPVVRILERVRFRHSLSRRNAPGWR